VSKVPIGLKVPEDRTTASIDRRGFLATGAAIKRIQKEIGMQDSPENAVN
jgi:hypothetical protein